MQLEKAGRENAATRALRIALAEFKYLTEILSLRKPAARTPT